MSTANSILPRLGKPEEPNLTLLDQLRHGTNSVLNRDVFINTMLEEQINCVGIQAREALLTGFYYVFRPASGPAARLPNLVAKKTLLRCPDKARPSISSFLPPP